MMEFVTNTLANLILVIFSVHNPLSILGKKQIFRKCFEDDNGNFLLTGRMRKNEQIPFFWLTNVSSSNFNTVNLKLFQGYRQDSGSAGAENVSDGLENDTKTNFQRDILGKVRFQKKWREAWSPSSSFVKETVLRNHGGKHRLEKKFKKYSRKINALGVYKNIRRYIIEVNSEGLR